MAASVPAVAPQGRRLVASSAWWRLLFADDVELLAVYLFDDDPEAVQAAAELGGYAQPVDQPKATPTSTPQIIRFRAGQPRPRPVARPRERRARRASSRSSSGPDSDPGGEPPLARRRGAAT